MISDRTQQMSQTSEEPEPAPDEPTDPPELILDADEPDTVLVFDEVGKRLWPPDETPTPDAMPIPIELGGEGGGA